VLNLHLPSPLRKGKTLLSLLSKGLKVDSADLYRRLLRYVLPYWRIFLFSIISLVLLGATEPILPALMKPLLDGSFIEQDPTARLLIPALIIGVFLWRGIAGFAGEMALNWVAHKVVMDLRNEMFQKLVMLPASFHDNTKSGELISKLTFDVAQVAQATTQTLTVLVRDSLAATGLLLYMLYLNWKLWLIAMLAAPVVGLIVTVVSRRLRSLNRKLQQSMGAMTEVIQETIDCQKVVKVFGGQSYEGARFRQASNQSRQYTMKIVTTSQANSPIIQVTMAMALATMIYIAASEARAGTLTVGDFIAFFTAMILLLPPVKRLTDINNPLQRGLAAAESIFALIDEPQEPDEGKMSMGRAAGEIRFCALDFYYLHQPTPVLSDVSVTIAAGETVALVGASGSGKTSLVSLIPRFYHPTSGRIALDGIDIRAITLQSLRRNIALVTQEVVLFNDTVRNNIAYGAMRELSDGEVLRAAQAAHVMEFVRTLPEGLETLIGEHGVRLSGGQRQRLAIARALLKDAPILILDEATSALDTASERYIQAALEALKRGRTCIVIAHRLSTIEHADRIMVLKHGRIVEIGTHAELIRRQGVYAELHRLQFTAETELI
jgi:ATP-binding cassette, subfamily B, bacterial MsbA